MATNNFERTGQCPEKVCIQAKRVFDACMKQVSLQQIAIQVSDVTPPNPTTPLRFVSSRSSSTTGTLTNLVVERLPERHNCGRVQADLNVPLEFTYLDANNVEGTGQGTLVLPIDVVMYLPEPSVIPYQIEATVSAISPEGAYTGTEVIDDITYYIFTINVCLTVILKVTMDVALVVSTFGYAQIPPSQDYTQEVCSGYFELPLYPQNS
ncbi:MAG: hypothetical protein J6R37_03360 [Clostridia bacterium]|nr:hypothetical protein [Clostridia bacterium]